MTHERLEVLVTVVHLKNSWTKEVAENLATSLDAPVELLEQLYADIDC